MIYQTGEKLQDLWSIYGVIELQPLYNVYRPVKKMADSWTLYKVTQAL
jgi:hypothetical protein